MPQKDKAHHTTPDNYNWKDRANREELDPTPLEITTELGRPPTMKELIEMHVGKAVYEATQSSEIDTPEEADGS